LTDNITTHWHPLLDARRGSPLWRRISVVASTGLLLCLLATPSSGQRLLHTSRPELIDSLISLMTIEEKVGQLVQFTPSWDTTLPRGHLNETQKDLIRKGLIGSLLNAVGADTTHRIQEIAVRESRLKIPLIFGYDVIHGYRTVFPIPLGEAATWDPELIQAAARVAATEASAAGLHWTFGPMADIARDPRWGRIAEGSGEDPFLGSAMAAARVRGFQGEDLTAPGTVLACPKHYAAYGAAEAGRDYNTVDVSERTLREVYLPPFEAAVRAGAGSIMCSFNEISGVPSSGNHRLLTEILRGEWNFPGFVVSDWGSIGEMVQHGFVSSPEDAARVALMAGVDMDMMSGAYASSLAGLVRSGKINQRILDEAVRRVLWAKFRLGLFADPYHGADPKREQRLTLTKDHRALAREVAARSMVLLKNSGGVLPLKPSVRSLAVIGPLAASTVDPLGPWSGRGDAGDVISVLEGIRTATVQGTRVLYARGCPIDSLVTDGFGEAVKAARESEVVVLVLGEGAWMSGEAASRSSIDLPGAQKELAKAVLSTGKPVVVVLMNGRPLTIDWLDEAATAILEAWFPGVEAGNGVADVLFGKVNPSGKLPVTFPRSIGQIPIYYAHKNTGRPIDEKEKYTSKYLDLPNTPLYPFGFGLSYTRFEYSSLKVDKDKVPVSGTLVVTGNVTNTGGIAGTEIVQLYVRDNVGSVTRPVKELKAFRRVPLAPGERAVVRFEVAISSLGVLDDHWRKVVEPGTFTVFLGGNSSDCLELPFEVTAR
jgi:beta-glucosidase